MEKFQFHPFELVGSEGAWGLFFYIILLPIFSTVHCGLPSAACITYPYNGDPKFESPKLYGIEFVTTWTLGLMCVLGFLSIAGFNVFGVGITKYISALARSIVDALRTTIVWIFGLIWTLSSNK